MPMYFAYGSNMDREAMQARCPASRPLGLAWLAAHRFFILESGYASVRRSSGGVVHGVLWDLALRDVAALDRYEAVGEGLYLKRSLPVHRAGQICAALVYIGRSGTPGLPLGGYMDQVVAAAESWELPASHVETLRRFRLAAPAFGPGGTLTRSPTKAADPPRMSRRNRES